MALALISQEFRLCIPETNFRHQPFKYWLALDFDASERLNRRTLNGIAGIYCIGF